jgi:hypothetical protein
LIHQPGAQTLRAFFMGKADMSDETPEANRLESLLLNAIFAMAAVGLLALIGTATRPGMADGGWWTKPALTPGVALALLVVANLLTLLRAVLDLRADPATPEEWHEARVQVLGWLRPMEFLGYFAVYLWAIETIGYFVATLVFVMGLMLRIKLNSPGWLLVGLGFIVTLILVFRVGLGVWMPTPAIYDAAPDVIRPYLLRWF